MTERYPDDSTLLALEHDQATGVEFIPTGKSPYHLEFRKLVQRLLLAAGRANDFRTYRDGDLTIGVRPGRCLLAGGPVDFAGVEGLALPNNATTYLWLDPDGAVQTDPTAMPADRTAFLPLAEVVTDAGTISAIVDRRGEAFAAVADLGLLGIQASAAEINQALAGVPPTVDAAALGTLTAGTTTPADTLHRHDAFVADLDAEHALRLSNLNPGPAAGVALAFELPGLLPGSADLFLDPAAAAIKQRRLGQAMPLLGSTHAALNRPGQLTASQSDLLLGPVPLAGAVTDVALSLHTNIESDNPADAVAAAVKVNGVALTTVDPALAAADGAGFRSTAQGHGVPAAVRTDGAEQVARGDILTVDLTRAVNGNVAVEPADLAVLVSFRPDLPA